MIRISTTHIESFRQYSGGLLEEETFLARLRRERPPTREMQLGTAFHSILENPTECYSIDKDVYIADGIEYQGEIIRRCIEFLPTSTTAIAELKETKIYDLGGELVEVVGKVDSIDGLIITEYKTCWGGFNFDKYYESCQWKFYIDIFGAMAVNYNVFCFYDSKRSGIQLKSVERFVMPVYHGMNQHIELLLKQFVDYIKFRGLDTLFTKCEKCNETRTVV